MFFADMQIYHSVNMVGRTENEGLWLWGDTGAGKSHEAFVDYDPDTHYEVNADDKGSGAWNLELVIKHRRGVFFSQDLYLILISDQQEFHKEPSH